MQGNKNTTDWHTLSKTNKLNYMHQKKENNIHKRKQRAKRRQEKRRM